MTKTLTSILAGCLAVFLFSSAHAEANPAALSKEEALTIISTMERLPARSYRVVHITDGSLEDENGFHHQFAKKVSFLGPQSNQNTSRSLKHHTMLYSTEYGWYLQRIATDTRGFYLEISSQTKGRVFVR